MADVFRARLRRIGSSVGVLIPKERLNEIGAEEGDEIDVALLKHLTPEQLEKELRSGLGMAKHFTEPFERDKKTREF